MRTMWGKPSVEADHEKWSAFHGREDGFDLIDFFCPHGKRLLDKHVLPGFEGTANQGSVAVVAGGDNYGVGAGIFDGGIDVGSRLGKPDFSACTYSAKASIGGNNLESRARPSEMLG